MNKLLLLVSFVLFVVSRCDTKFQVLDQDQTCSVDSDCVAIMDHCPGNCGGCGPYTPVNTQEYCKYKSLHDALNCTKPLIHIRCKLVCVDPRLSCTNGSCVIDRKGSQNGLNTPSCDDNDSSESSTSKCPNGAKPFNCLISPCLASRCTVAGAKCTTNYCGGCNAVWKLSDGTQVCKPGDSDSNSNTGCPDGKKPFNCLLDPCSTSHCSVVGANCSSNYCGGCNAVWKLQDGTQVCKNGDDSVTPSDDSSSGCPGGMKPFNCFMDPCVSSQCSVAGATCNSNYCGGCNAVWKLQDGTQVCKPVDNNIAPNGGIGEPQDSPPKTAIIVGSVIAVVASIAIIIGVVVGLRYYQSKKQQDGAYYMLE
jgi:hypothetical protein